MKNSSHSLLYRCLDPGFLFLSGLLLTTISFLIYQAREYLQMGLVFVILVYFLLLLFKKYSELRVLVVFMVIIFIVRVSSFNNKQKEPMVTQSLIVQIDSVQVSDDFITGRGDLGKQRVIFSIKKSRNIEYILKKRQNFIIYQINGKLEKIESPTTLGQVDYRKFYASKGIYWKLRITQASFCEKKQTLEDRLHCLRAYLQEKFHRFPKYISFMLSEMILAENSDDNNQETIETYRNLGIIHLLSISGLHVGIYTLAISYLCTFFKRTELEALLICGTFLIIEVFLSNYQAGFVRASMAYVLQKSFSLKKIPLAQGDILGLVLILHLFLSPNLFLNSGAILSYLLVIGLDMTNNLGGIKQSFSLNLLITPILLKFFYQINVITVFYNFLIVPVFNFILLPLTFVALIFGDLFPVIMNPIEDIFSIIMKATNAIGRLKLGMLNFGQINWWQTIFLFILTVALLLIKKKKLLYGLLISYILLFVSIHYPLWGKVSFIDVGQGDSILITTPLNRKAYLIDTGGKVSFGKKKVKPQVEYITLPYLYSQGIDHLDGIFVSHQDADHVGDIGPLLDKIPVKRLYYGQGLLENKTFKRRIMNRKNTPKLIPLLAGSRIKDGINWSVVYPFNPGEGKNEDSLSLFFEIAGKKWLFTGDLDQEGEKKILERYPIKVDYYKLGHHGSKTSSNIDFLKSIQPKIVFISAGRNNRFGHPHPETLETLKKLEIPALSTQDNGTITWNYSLWGKSYFSTFLKRESR